MNSASEHNLPTLEELKKLRTPIRNVNLEHVGRLTKLERFAIWIAPDVFLPSWRSHWIFSNGLTGPIEGRFLEQTGPGRSAETLWLMYNVRW